MHARSLLSKGREGNIYIYIHKLCARHGQRLFRDRGGRRQSQTGERKEKGRSITNIYNIKAQLVFHRQGRTLCCVQRTYIHTYIHTSAIQEPMRTKTKSKSKTAQQNEIANNPCPLVLVLCRLFEPGRQLLSSKQANKQTSKQGMQRPAVWLCWSSVPPLFTSPAIAKIIHSLIQRKEKRKKKKRGRGGNRESRALVRNNIWTKARPLYIYCALRAWSSGMHQGGGAGWVNGMRCLAGQEWVGERTEEWRNG